jgi:dTDP-4-amino-4,6-dideoxygalactose transaminase
MIQPVTGIDSTSTKPPPYRKTAPKTWPVFEQDEIDSVTATLASGRVNYWTGEQGRAFEREFALAVGCRHAIALANGTVALELALQALGIGPGDEVVTTSRTFIASASAAVMRGAAPVIADVDRDSQNLTAQTVEAVLTPRTRAIVAVHLAGWPCDMDPILALARERGLVVVEDCAQALGATYRGQPVGSLGDAAAFSFCQDKILTTGGEGGMMTTNDYGTWQRAWSFKDHGKAVAALTPARPGGGFRWLHDTFGTNWRLSEMQSAIGRIQLGKLPQWLAKRRANAAVLTAGFARIPGLRVTVPLADVEHAYYKYYAFVEPERFRPCWNRDRIIQAIVARGVPCFSGSCGEIYREMAFVRSGLGPGRRLPVARELAATSLMFLLHPTLGTEDMVETCEVVRDVMLAATFP